MQKDAGGIRPSRHPAAVEETDVPAVHFGEFPDTRTERVEMLRAHCGDWFHRMQMELIGIGIARRGGVDTIGANRGDRFNTAQAKSIGLDLA